MTARVLDGATLWQGGREWTWHEDVDDDGRRFGWSECEDCGGTVLGGDDARQDHDCPGRCPECNETNIGTHTTDGITVHRCCGEEVRCPNCGSTALRYDDRVGAHCGRCPWSAS